MPFAELPRERKTCVKCRVISVVLFLFSSQNNLNLRGGERKRKKKGEHNNNKKKGEKNELKEREREIGMRGNLIARVLAAVPLRRRLLPLCPPLKTSRKKKTKKKKKKKKEKTFGLFPHAFCLCVASNCHLV
jgi:hypothetical protein